MITIKHQLLSTHITALKVKEDFIFIGEGQHIHIHHLRTGERVTSVGVFRGAAVHGIQLPPPPNPDAVTHTPTAAVWVLVVFGQKSLAVLTFCPVERKCHVVLEEVCVVDWIVDVAWEKNGSHLIIALAHNSLLRYKLPNAAQNTLKTRLGSTCTIKSESQDRSRESGQTAPKCTENTDCCLGGYSRGSQGINQNIVENSKCAEKRVPYSECIVQEAESAEKSVLYSGCIVMTSGTWESAVLLAGTIEQEVLVWGPCGEVDNNNRILPYHRLRGHQGSIFSVSFCPDQRVIATTSDDRSVRVWQVIQAKENTKSDSSKAELAPSDCRLRSHYWRDSYITEKFKSYGHSARIWKSIILPKCLVSVGEDSNVCVWNFDGMLASSWKAHDGASIWSVAATESPDLIVTGAGDGSVRAWSLGSKDPIVALPLADLPNSSTQHSSDSTQTSDTFEVHDDLRKYRDELEDGAPVLIDNKDEANVKLPGKKKDKTPKQDFPRCVSLMGASQSIVVMDSGKLYSWHHQSSSSWQLQYKDDRLRNYSVLQVSHNYQTAALATLYGDIIVLSLEQERLKVLMDVKVSEGKIFSVLWLSGDMMLVCGGGGVMTVWQLQTEACKMTARQSHILPASKQRWASAACLYPAHQKNTSNTTNTTTTTPNTTIDYLVCGDRTGSLHLYHSQTREAIHSLRGLHGRNGVTSVMVVQGWLVLSSGRDGCVRRLTVQGDRLQVITVTRVSGGVSWVARLIFTHKLTLAVCFHDVKMKVWSVDEERDLVEVECGGGHRSWDARILEGCDKLVFLYLKDARAFMFTTALKDKLLPVIKSPVNSQETLCLQVLHCTSEEVVFATGGEDTTLRLHSITGSESRQSLGVIRSHISNIRTLCVIDGSGRMNDYEKTEHDDSSVWVVSAGGRAQVKIWKATIASGFAHQSKDFTKVNEQNYSHSSYPGTANTEQKDNPGKITNVFNPCSEEDLNSKQHNNDNAARKFNSDNIICREVTSHMLRTGSHKTWKSQELTFDPETRYMDATAFWITESIAFVLLASSDGILRIFQFCALSEAVRLVCSEECNHCILRVTRLQVVGKNILVSATTGGNLVFWDAQNIVDWMKQEKDDDEETHPLAPRLHQLASVCVHQSGVNSLAFSELTEGTTTTTTTTTAHPGTKQRHHNTIMATGGDDNKLGVWQVMVDTSEKETPTVTVVSLCDAYGHASQITGLHWLSDTFLLSTSVDQRLLLWKLDKVCEEGQDEQSTSQMALKCMSGHFTGVPDVKGLAVVDCGESRQSVVIEDKRKHINIKKKVLVYGMGLQVFEITISNSIV
ncbi:hypothetical protein Pcinc_020314 [Petrolisthes cinctipes]|uniref:tRNA (34-2'-O)-methyltransferase regulator WDR6 n=1 Tax=Petrolisthes cinctipes TaxID=88211 RepID=A0AAE1KJY4_PETCI|nr:hypothetical protein Pcinc_020314 [Petrolisthes cinctipes]